MNQPANNADLLALAEGLEAAVYRKTYQQFFDFRPYKRQKEFLDAGGSFSERLLIAGNQNGKTHIGAYEVACHMTGLYPANWKGRRFDKPTRGWIAGETSLERVRAIHGQDVIWITPDEVAVLMASVEGLKAVGAVKQFFPGAEIIRRYEEAGT